MVHLDCSYVLNDLDGNAVDAAIAATFCHMVVHPQSNGLGGGGFATYYNRCVTFRNFLFENCFCLNKRQAIKFNARGNLTCYIM